jgi:hypothetical protein
MSTDPVAIGVEAPDDRCPYTDLPDRFLNRAIEKRDRSARTPIYQIGS